MVANRDGYVEYSAADGGDDSDGDDSDGDRCPPWFAPPACFGGDAVTGTARAGSAARDRATPLPSS